MIGRFSSEKHGKMRPPQIIILMIVRNEKKYGYEILKELRDVFGETWEPKTGSIYPLIKKMQENGLLDSEMIDDREYYGLTKDGSEALMEILPRIGGMISVAARFMTLVNKVIDEFGIEPANVNDMICETDVEKLDHLREIRDHLRDELEKIEEMISKNEGKGNE